MKYDSKKTLSENNSSIKLDEQITGAGQVFQDDEEDCIPKNISISRQKGKLRNKQYPSLGSVGDGKCHCEKNKECLEFKKSCCTDTKVTLSIPSEYEYEQSKLSNVVVVKSAGPGKFITIPASVINKVEFLEWGDKNKPYNERQAKYMFGESCKFLAGEYPNEPTGFNELTDYYVDDKGEKCKKIGEEVFIYNWIYSKYTDYLQKSKVNNDGSRQILYYSYSEKGKNSFKKASGKDLENIIKKVQFDVNLETGAPTEFSQEGIRKVVRNDYGEKCKPLPYETCLRWCWSSFHTFGMTDGGLKKFRFNRTTEVEKQGYGSNVGGYGTETIVEPEEYEAFFRMENFYEPWLAYYSGKYGTKGQGLSADSKVVGQNVANGHSGELLELPDFPDLYSPTTGLSSDPLNMVTTNDETREKFVQKGIDKVTQMADENNIDPKMAEYYKTLVKASLSSGLRIEGK